MNMNSLTDNNHDDGSNTITGVDPHNVTPLKTEIGHGENSNSNMKKRKFDDGHNDEGKQENDHRVDESKINKKHHEPIIRPDAVVSYTNRDGDDDADDDDSDEEEYKVEEGQFPTFVQLDHLLNTLCAVKPLRKNDQDDSFILGKLNFLIGRFRTIETGKVVGADGGSTSAVPISTFMEDFIALAGPVRILLFLRRNMQNPKRVADAARVCLAFSMACLSRQTIIEEMVDRGCLKILVLAIEECGSENYGNVWVRARFHAWLLILDVIRYADHSKIDFDDKLLPVAEVVVDYFKVLVGSAANGEFGAVIRIVCGLLQKQKTKMTRFCRNNGVISTILKYVQGWKWKRTNSNAAYETIIFGVVCVRGGLLIPSDAQRLISIVAEILETHSTESNSRTMKGALEIIGKVADTLPKNECTEKTKTNVCNILLGIIQQSYKSNQDGESVRSRHMCQEVLSKISPPSLLYE